MEKNIRAAVVSWLTVGLCQQVSAKCHQRTVQSKTAAVHLSPPLEGRGGLFGIEKMSAFWILIEPDNGAAVTWSWEKCRKSECCCANCCKWCSGRLLKCVRLSQAASPPSLQLSALLWWLTRWRWVSLRWLAMDFCTDDWPTLHSFRCNPNTCVWEVSSSLCSVSKKPGGLVITVLFWAWQAPPWASPSMER